MSLMTPEARYEMAEEDQMIIAKMYLDNGDWPAVHSQVEALRMIGNHAFAEKILEIAYEEPMFRAYVNVVKRNTEYDD